MNAFDLTKIFADATNSLGADLIKDGIKLIIGGAVGGVATLWAVSRSKMALINGKHSGDPAYVMELFLNKLDEINPNTGEHFYRVKLRNHILVDIKDIFLPSIKHEVFSHLKKAAERCTKEANLVYEFLPEILKDKKHRDQILDRLDKQLSAYFEAIATPRELLCRDLPKYNAPKEVLRFPTILFENGEVEQYYIFWLKDYQLDTSYYPRDENLLFERESDRHIYDMVKIAVGRLSLPENEFAKKICSVPIPVDTGSVLMAR